MKKKKPLIALRPFDKHFYYLHSVQDPERNMALLHQFFVELRGRAGLTLREDFCGTFANACAWVELGPEYTAHAIDADPEPIAYGREHHLPTLTAEQQARVSAAVGDPTTAMLARADLVAAINFACSSFHQRAGLKAYCERVRESLNPGGMVVFDLLGGPYYEELDEYEHDLDEPEPFTYFWEQETLDPISQRSRFHIHFKRKGEPKRRRVFSYDFRLWSIPELKDVLLESGFADVKVYWEGLLPNGDGDEIWTLTEKGDARESWSAYVVGLK